MSASTTSRKSITPLQPEVCNRAVIRALLCRHGAPIITSYHNIYLFCFVQVPCNRRPGFTVAISHVLAVIAGPEQTKAR